MPFGSDIFERGIASRDIRGEMKRGRKIIG